ncbi:MAG: methionyl-tRNA formyltransferase [Flavobacteriales bacterium]
MSKKLRIIFMGTPDFAVETLKVLVENEYNVVGVITSPDRPAGRGQKINESAVKKYAVDQGLTVLQPLKFKNEEFLAELKALNANLQIVVAFRMLPEVVWDMPQYGTFNLHASLLPQYRGAAPINWAIMNGEKESGVTTFFIEKEIDTGKILFQEKVEIGEKDNAGILHDKLMATGGKLVLKTVKAIEKDDFTETSQESLFVDEKDLKPAHKIFKQDCKIDWTRDINEINNFVRGLSPYPCAWTEFEKDEKTLSAKIYEVEIIDTKKYDFNVDSDNKSFIHISTPKGKLSIIEFQPAGKRKMKVEDYLKGNKFDAYSLAI